MVEASRTFYILQLLLLAAQLCTHVNASASVSTTSGSYSYMTPQSFRRLEGEDENENEEGGNDMDLTDYSIQEGTCFRVKVPSESDDDGNSYFYNGAYHAQYTRYTSLQLCNSDNGGTCSNYVVNLDDYLQVCVYYLKDLCTMCKNQCANYKGGKRQLEDQQEGGDDAAAANNGNDDANMWDIDCNSCPNTCNSVLNNEGADERLFMDCAESYQDNDIQYYAAPQCDAGNVIIGSFYDDECTYKASMRSDLGFDYTIFQTIQGMSVDCNSGYCNNLIADAIDCANANNGDNNNNNNAKLCKQASHATEILTYTRTRKQHMHTGIIMLSVLLSVGFSFLSYTYYIRHRKSQKVPMANLDGTDVVDEKDLPTVA